jgi:hypothetical protein
MAPRGNVTVCLDAAGDLGNLIDAETPEDVWIRSTGNTTAWQYPVITIRGPYDNVKKFVDDHWGLENFDSFDELIEKTT